ncbi:MAG: prepilin-type N-terminal cleavage/methylation domain-containing protein [Candidatus Levybacteria bacterium]|nr:prepilin-type N-terminal cleavage/methylation domain-containing protein [Candidatus Levybacteria bacterium]
MKTAQLKYQKGFTLIELLVVIGILAVLLAITLIAINPARQFSQANNTQRASDVNAILNAVGQYAVDNNGDLTALGIPVAPAAAGNIGNAGINLCSALVPTYIAELPVDPQTGSYTDCTTYDTQYEIVRSNTDSRVTVNAPDTEIPPAAAIINVTR